MASASRGKVQEPDICKAPRNLGTGIQFTFPYCVVTVTVTGDHCSAVLGGSGETATLYIATPVDGSIESTTALTSAVDDVPRIAERHPMRDASSRL